MSTKNKTALLLGSYGQTNLGDDLLLRNHIYYLQKLGFTEIIINANEAALVPSSLRKMVTIRSTYRTSILTWLRLIRTCDVVVYGGGTIYKELYKSTGRTRYSVVLRIAVFNLICWLLRCSVVNLNVGIGHLDTWFGKFLTKIALQTSTLTVFRDRRSYAYAHNELAVRGKKIRSGYDALFLDDYWLASDTPKKSAHPVTVGLNFLSDIPDWVDRGQYIESVVALIDHLTHQNCQVRFLPFQVDFNQNNDLVFYNQIIRPKLQAPTRVMVVEELSIENVLQHYKDLDILVCMRLHAMILATATATPFLGIEYDTKCTRFLREINYGCSLDFDTLSPASLVKKYTELQQSRTAAAAILKKEARSMYEAAQESMKPVDEFLSNV